MSDMRAVCTTISRSFAGKGDLDESFPCKMPLFTLFNVALCYLWPFHTCATRFRGRLLLFCVILFSVFLGVPTEAQGASLKTEVGARKVGVGQTFEVRVTAVREEGEPAPETPRLRVQGEATLRGPSISTQQSVRMLNFSFQRESSIVATWQVTPRKEGKLVVGPGTFQVGSQTLRGEVIVVDVVKNPQNSRRKRSSFFRDDPFEMFQRRRRTIMDLPEAPRRYQVAHAPHGTGFIRAIVDTKNAVLGQPIRLTLVAYGSRGNFREVTPTEPALSNFLSYSVIESSHDTSPMRTTVDGKNFLVRELRQFILIPLTTGELEVGVMTAVFQGNGRSYPPQGSPHGLKVASQPLTITIHQPPQKNRPPGYFPGDVGRYQMQVDLNPRTLQNGQFTEVIVSIKGKGEIPSKVILPESSKFTWEPPSLRGGPEIKDGELQGTRVLKFMLQANREGSYELGKVTLPYYDHRSRRYRVAEASLGKIKVSAASIPSTPTASANDALPQKKESDSAELSSMALRLKPRQLAQPYQDRTQLPLPAYAWWLALGFPLLLSAFSPLKKLSRSLFSRKNAPSKSLANEALKGAKNALRAENKKDAFRYLERALYEGIDDATGMRSRGSLIAHLAQEAEKAGLNQESAQQAQALLEKIEGARYGAPSLPVEELYQRTKKLLLQLVQAKKRRLKSRLNVTKGAL